MKEPVVMESTWARDLYWANKLVSCRRGFHLEKMLRFVQAFAVARAGS